MNNFDTIALFLSYYCYRHILCRSMIISQFKLAFNKQIRPTFAPVGIQGPQHCLFSLRDTVTPKSFSYRDRELQRDTRAVSHLG